MSFTPIYVAHCFCPIFDEHPPESQMTEQGSQNPKRPQKHISFRARHSTGSLPDQSAAKQIISHPNSIQTMQQTLLTKTTLEASLYFQKFKSHFFQYLTPSISAPSERGICNIYKIKNSTFSDQKTENKHEVHAQPFSLLAVENGFCPTGWYSSEKKIRKNIVQKAQRITTESHSNSSRQNVSFTLINIAPMNIRITKAQARAFLKKENAIATFLIQKNVPHILKNQLVHFFKKPDLVLLRLLTEECEHGTLKDYIQTETNNVARIELGLQIAQALCGLHKNGIYHLNLTCNNILVTEDKRGKPCVRISDFRTSEKQSDAKTLNSLGIVSEFPSPEMVHSQTLVSDTPLSSTQDLWNLGAILFQLKYNCNPLMLFNVHNNANELYDINLHNMMQWLNTTLDVSSDEINLCLKRLLSLNPAERPSAEEVSHFIEQWLREQIPTSIIELQTALTRPEVPARKFIERCHYDLTTTLNSSAKSKMLTYPCTTCEAHELLYRHIDGNRLLGLENPLGQSGFYVINDNMGSTHGDFYSMVFEKIDPSNLSKNNKKQKVDAQLIFTTPLEMLNPRSKEKALVTLQNKITRYQTLQRDNIPFIEPIVPLLYHTHPESSRIGILKPLFDLQSVSAYATQEPDLVKRMEQACNIAFFLKNMHKKGHLHLFLSDECIQFHNDGTRTVPVISNWNIIQTIGDCSQLQDDLKNEYPAPEMVAALHSGQAFQFSSAVDLWNLGDLIHILWYGISILQKCNLTNTHSREFFTNFNLLERYVETKLKTEHNTIPLCIAKLLSSDPSLRPSAEEVHRTIHTWLHSSLSQKTL